MFKTVQRTLTNNIVPSKTTKKNFKKVQLHAETDTHKPFREYTTFLSGEKSWSYVCCNIRQLFCEHQSQGCCKYQAISVYLNNERVCQLTTFTLNEKIWMQWLRAGLSVLSVVIKISPIMIA